MNPLPSAWISLACGACWFVATSAVAAQCIEHESQRLVPADGAAGDGAGVSIDLSGTTAVVGSFQHEHSGAPRNSGCAYVLDFAGGMWSETTELLASDGEQGDRLGYAVAIDGDFLAVAAPFADSTLHAGVLDSGAVYVYQRLAGTWTQTQLLAPADDNDGQHFGYDLELEGDVLAIGAPGEDDLGTKSGAVHVYRFDGAQWVFEQELHASDGGTSLEFGYSVGTDGTRFVAGSPGNGANLEGAAYTFTESGGVWTQEQKLVPGRAGPNDFYGDTVDVDQGWVAVGSIDQDFNEGAVALFHFDGATWQESAELKASDATAGAEFASRVEICGDGVVVGAFLADAAGVSTSGSAYLFRFGGTSWVEQVRWIPSDPSTGSNFGFCALDGDRALIGAPAAAGTIGALYAYTRSDLSLTSNQDSYASGDPLDLCMGGAVPGTPLLLYAVSPFVIRILTVVANPEGRSEFHASTPPGLSGLDVDLLTFGFPSLSTLGASNVLSLHFL